MDEQLFVLVWEEEDVRLSHSSELLESISVHGYVSTESAVIFQSFSWVFEVPIQHTYFWGVLGGGGDNRNPNNSYNFQIHSNLWIHLVVNTQPMNI